jgi:hypothetical protein
VFSQFIQTEEFEALDPRIQLFIEQYCQYISDKLTAIKQNSMPAGQPGSDPNAMALEALQAASGQGKNPLAAQPGKDSTQQIEHAAGAMKARRRTPSFSKLKEIHDGDSSDSTKHLSQGRGSTRRHEGWNV